MSRGKREHRRRSIGNSCGGVMILMFILIIPYCILIFIVLSIAVIIVIPLFFIFGKVIPIA